MATEKIDEILANLKDLGAAVNRLEQNDVSVKCRLVELEDRIENTTPIEGASHLSPSVYERACHTINKISLFPNFQTILSLRF